MTVGRQRASDLVVPFIFVSRGQPDPAEWLAAHPGAIRIPARLVPRQVEGKDEGSTMEFDLNDALSNFADANHYGVAAQNLAAVATATRINAEIASSSSDIPGDRRISKLEHQPGGAKPAAASALHTTSEATTLQQSVAQEDSAFEGMMASREGSRNDVYLDSRHNPTVGIGHRVVREDHLKVGDHIDDRRISELFRSDSEAAMSAARAQAQDAGIADPSFVTHLAAVDLQLGSKWIEKFPETWRLITEGKYESAARALDQTPWAHQTPLRVEDFQNALRHLQPKH